LQRHEVVAEATKERRDHHEEHHQDAVIGDHHVPQVPVWRTRVGRICYEARALKTHVLNTGVHQLKAHVDGESHRNEAQGTGNE